MSTPEDLLDTARSAAERSYSPYSSYRVGAVAIAGDGRRYVGVNVENAAYGSTMCAEATAIAAAASDGVRKIDAVAVAALEAGECFPCGNCRQLMREFDVDEIIVEDGEGRAKVFRLEELLPHSFGPEHLPE